MHDPAIRINKNFFKHSQMSKSIFLKKAAVHFMLLIPSYSLIQVGFDDVHVCLLYSLYIEQKLDCDFSSTISYCFFVFGIHLQMYAESTVSQLCALQPSKSNFCSVQSQDQARFPIAVLIYLVRLLSVHRGTTGRQNRALAGCGSLTLIQLEYHIFTPVSCSYLQLLI